MKFKLPSGLTSKIGRQILEGQKHSPTILFAGGVIGIVGTTVLACRATLKLEQVIDESQRNMKTSKNLVDMNRPDYTADDHKKDMLYIYIRTAVSVTKLYGPSILLGAVSIGALAGSHNILSKRNAAVTAAYAAVEKGFREYRARVVEELGAEKDREFRYGSETRTVVEEQPSGQMKKLQVKGFGPNGGSSMYAKLFDSNNQNWDAHPEYNILFLRSKQNWCNDRLQAKGHLLLNDVYDELGFERTKAGCVVGWVWDPNGNTEGNNFIDFGVFTDEAMDRFYDFVTGREGCILLDFNVDGVIYDKI